MTDRIIEIADTAAHSNSTSPNDAENINKYGVI